MSISPTLLTINRLQRLSPLSPRQCARSAGFTLIELMVALVLGLVVVGGVMGVFMSTYQANAQNIKSIRLNEEMRAVMSMMSRDIRRAGTRSFAWNATTTNWFVTNYFAATGTNWVITRYDSTAPVKSCALFTYDTNGNNTLDNVDRMGYRLNPVTGAIDAYNHTSTGDWACNGNNWQPITDPKIAWVRSLVFTTTTEPSLPGIGVRTVVVTLRAATNTRSASPSTLTAADCTKIDVVCRQIVEKIRIRNDAVL